MKGNTVNGVFEITRWVLTDSIRVWRQSLGVYIYFLRSRDLNASTRICMKNAHLTREYTLARAFVSQQFRITDDACHRRQ